MEYSLDPLRMAIAPSKKLLENSNRQTQAAVAAILHRGAQGPEMLFIKRSLREGDPWSGHIAFPGGKIEPSDPSPQAAAEREASEEIGLALRKNECLGCLQPLVGLRVSIAVSCFVYRIDTKPAFEFSSEVAEAFWIRFSNLTDPSNQTTYCFVNNKNKAQMPAIRLREEDGTLLWGITYRFVQEILGLARTKSTSSSNND